MKSPRTGANALLLPLLIAFAPLQSRSESNPKRGIRHFPLFDVRARLNDISRRDLQIEIVEDEDLDQLYQGIGTHYVDLDVGKGEHE